MATKPANQLQDLPVGVTLESAPHGICRWRWPLPEQLPRVSVIIPTRNGLAHLRPCIESPVQHTRYPNIEIMVMDNQSDDPDTLAYFGYITREYGVRVIARDHPFNYSAINNAGVREATGELICLLNNDTEVINPQWLDEMVSHLLRPGVGIVGQGSSTAMAGSSMRAMPSGRVAAPIIFTVGWPPMNPATSAGR